MKSKEVLNNNNEQYHICCKKGDIGRYVILPGDPFRTDIIAKKLDNARLVAHNREHRTWTGYLDGEMVSVTSTGMGGPSTAIAVEELIHCGADTLIRIGTCGRVCDESKKNQIGCIINAAIRDEGTTRQYVPIEYPAVANREIVEILSTTAKKLGYNFAEGIAHCKDSFYAQHSPESMPISKELIDKWEIWKNSNVMASEMETSTLFIVSLIRKVRAGAIMAYISMNDETINVLIDSIRELIKRDKKY